jgi:hypothetical protein
MITVLCGYGSYPTVQQAKMFKNNQSWWMKLYLNFWFYRIQYVENCWQWEGEKETNCFKKSVYVKHESWQPEPHRVLAPAPLKWCGSLGLLQLLDIDFYHSQIPYTGKVRWFPRLPSTCLKFFGLTVRKSFCNEILFWCIHGAAVYCALIKNMKGTAHECT